MLRPLVLFLLLYAYWLLLSGLYQPFLLIAGAGSALAVVWMARRMRLLDAEGLPWLGWRIVGYWLWLGREIVISGLQVSRIILHPRLPISPTLVHMVPAQRTAVGLVVHANSITLTPGTITVDADPGRFVVHGLTGDGARAVVDSEMSRRISRCEGDR